MGRWGSVAWAGLWVGLWASAEGGWGRCSAAWERCAKDRAGLRWSTSKDFGVYAGWQISSPGELAEFCGALGGRDGEDDGVWGCVREQLGKGAEKDVGQWCWAEELRAQPRWPGRQAFRRALRGWEFLCSLHLHALAQDSDCLTRKVAQCGVGVRCTFQRDACLEPCADVPEASMVVVGNIEPFHKGAAHRPIHALPVFPLLLACSRL